MSIILEVNVKCYLDSISKIILDEFYESNHFPVTNQSPVNTSLAEQAPIKNHHAMLQLTVLVLRRNTRCIQCFMKVNRNNYNIPVPSIFIKLNFCLKGDDGKAYLPKNKKVQLSFTNYN